MEPMMRTLTTAIALLCLVAGCAHKPPEKKDDDGTKWAQQPVAPATPGAIYQESRQLTLFENPIAHRIGDIVTIVLSEQTQGQKSSTTDTSKQTTDSLPGINLLGKALTIKGNPVTAASINDQSQFKGEGDSAQSNSLTGYVAVTVTKVLPNGNLFVQGEKDIWINQGSEQIKLSGVIRPIDLAADNSIPSYRVADAKISYGGKGALNDANAQGWLSRFFNSPWSPF